MNWLPAAGQDVVYAVRGARRTPGVVTVILLTFALGIGANTAIFSAVNSILLRPLPYRDPQRLVVVENARSLPQFETFRDDPGAFESAAAYTDESVNLTDGLLPERVDASRISAGLFPMLGIAPALGRTFTPAEDQPGGAQVVILSHSLWQRRYHGDPGIIGRSIQAGGQSLTVIGVLGEGAGLAGEPFEVWMPRVFECTTFSRESIRLGAGILTLIGRLRPGVSLHQTNARLRVMDGREAGKDAGDLAYVRPLQDHVVGTFRSNLLVLWAAVGCMLLICCANIANLLLARGASRRSEVSIRLALGASRGRIARQFCTESLVMALGGGLLGLPLAAAGIRLLAQANWGDVARSAHIQLDGTALGAAFLLSAACGILFGMAPALGAARADLHDALEEASRGSSGRSHMRLRSVLVVAEVAGAAVLLVSAGVFLRSFALMRAAPTGLHTDHVLALQIDLPPVRYEAPRSRAMFFQEVLRRVGSLPGVVVAGAAHPLHLLSRGTQFVIRIEGQPDRGDLNPVAKGRIVSPDYLSAVRVPLLGGRGFEQGDTADSPRVMLVSQAFARKFFPDQNPLGQHVTYSTVPVTCEIVGVVGDVRPALLDPQPNAEFYVPFTQRPWLKMSLAVRTIANPALMAGAVRRQIAAVDPEQPAAHVMPMEDEVGEAVSVPRSTAGILLLFAAAALALAAVGVYGVVSYSVASRAREMGVRMALGCSAGRLCSHVVRRSMGLVLGGLALGLPIAALAGRLYSALLFGVGAADPLAMAGAGAALFAAALAASYLPARYIARIDPVRVLRSQ
jgi:predicted permease